MILLAEKDITFKQTAERLFPYLTNMENYGEWFPGVLAIESVDAQPHASVGKRYKETLTMPTGEATLLIEVKDSLLNTLLYTEGDLSPMLPAMKMVFDENENQTTTFHLSYYSRNPELTEDDAIIKALRKDLSERLDVAARNLLGIMPRWNHSSVA